MHRQFFLFLVATTLLVLLSSSTHRVDAQVALLGPSDYNCNNVAFIGTDRKSPCRCCSIDCNRFLLFKKDFSEAWLNSLNPNVTHTIPPAESTCKRQYYNYGCHIKAHCIQNSYFGELKLAAAYCMMYNGCTMPQDVMNSAPKYTDLTKRVYWLLNPVVKKAFSVKKYSTRDLESEALKLFGSQTAAVFFNFKQLQDVRDAIFTYKLNYTTFVNSQFARLPFKKLPYYMLEELDARFPDQTYYDAVKTQIESSAQKDKKHNDEVLLPMEKNWKNIKETVYEFHGKIDAQQKEYEKCRAKRTPNVCKSGPLYKRDQLDCDSVDEACLQDFGSEFETFLQQVKDINNAEGKIKFYGKEVTWKQFKESNAKDPRGIDDDDFEARNKAAEDAIKESMKGVVVPAPFFIAQPETAAPATAKPKAKATAPKATTAPVKRAAPKKSKIKTALKKAKKAAKKFTKKVAKKAKNFFKKIGQKFKGKKKTKAAKKSAKKPAPTKKQTKISAPKKPAAKKIAPKKPQVKIAAPKKPAPTKKQTKISAPKKPAAKQFAPKKPQVKIAAPKKPATKKVGKKL